MTAVHVKSILLFIVATNFAPAQTATPAKSYSLQNWKNITCRGKGRFQDKGYCESAVIDRIVTDGESAIPVLISQITDSRTMANTVYDFWPTIQVGELAYFILENLFTDETWAKSTIPDLFPRDRCSQPGWECWAEFRKTHSLKLLQEKWTQFWKANQNQISWDSKARCFRLQGYTPR